MRLAAVSDFNRGRARLSLQGGLLAAGAVLSLLPFVSTVSALVSGAVLGLSLGNPFPARTRRWAHRLLALSVIGLGAGMDLRAVAVVGVRGAGVTAIGIGACLAGGALLTRWLRVETTIGVLVSLGTAICGGSAIAAAAPVLRAKEHAAVAALATVFTLNAAALVVFPVLGHALALDPARFGLWCALAIHDTSSVVGAAMTFGPRATEVATAVKLARALWIVPVTLGLGVVMARKRTDGDASESAPSPKPWFIAGFLMTAAVSTFVPGAHALGAYVSGAAKHAMGATLFLVGSGITRPALRQVGGRPFLLGLLLWIAVATLSLIAIHAGVVTP